MPDGGASELYRVRDLVVDVTGASVSRGGERIVLPPRTFELLVALVRRYPSIVRRHDLLDAVWPDEHVSDQTLSHRVMVLRKALGDHAEEPAYVAGERGFGYRLVAPVERIDPAAHEASAPIVTASRATKARRAALLVVGGATLLALAAWGAWTTSGRRARGGALGPAPPSVASHDAASRTARVQRLCLRGEFFFLAFTREGLRRSAEAWEEAVVLEPAAARVHAGRAMTGAVRALLDLVSVAEAERLARDAARRALELEPASSAAQLSASLVRLLFDWDPAGASAAALAASRRDPEDVRGPIVLALALLGEGRLEEAERVLGAAALSDPNAAAVAFLEGHAHQMRARWTAAAAAYTRAVALEPELAAARRGCAESLAAAGQRGEALAALSTLFASARDDGPAGSLSEAWRRLCGDATSGDAIHACLLAGDRERAERLLAAATSARAPYVVFAPHDPLLQPLRRGPAMRSLLARLRRPAPGKAGP